GPPHAAGARDHLGGVGDGPGQDGRAGAGGDRRDAAAGGRSAAAQGAAMKLSDVLATGHVLLTLRAATVKEATEQLADRLVAAGAVAEPQRLLAVIKHAWPEDMVSVGEHAFLPQFRTEAVRGLIAAIGIPATPTRRDKGPHRTAPI